MFYEVTISELDERWILASVLIHPIPDLLVHASLRTVARMYEFVYCTDHLTGLTSGADERD
jgi:hypothetical protein